MQGHASVDGADFPEAQGALGGGDRNALIELAEFLGPAETLFGVVQSDGSVENASEVKWEVPAGSQLRLQQMLAELDYLPYKWDGEEVAKSPEAQVAAATTEPPKGHFSPRWGNTPAGLKELWTPGESNVLVEGALMSFEERNGLEVDGIAGPVVWEALRSLSRA